METNFTGGEWKVKNSPQYHEPKSSTIEIHSKRSQGWIAKIQNTGVIRHKEGLANAKLIAAAPDMFNALEELLAQVKQFTDGNIGEQDYFRDEIYNAKKAIKKATE